MSNGITTIPTRTDGSVGRVKSNADPIEDLDTELPAEEYNVLADTVCGLSREMGTTDGLTPGSVIERLNNIEALMIPSGVKITGSLNQTVTQGSGEVVIGALGAFDPTTYNTPSLVLEATYTFVPATSGSIEIRLYDRGTRASPVAGTLRATISTTFADAGVLKCVSKSLFVNAAPGVNTDQIYDYERIYELRAELVGATPGDELKLGAVSLIVTPVLMGGGPAASPTAGYVTIGPAAGMANERTLATAKSVTHVDGGPGGAVTVELVNDSASPGNFKTYGTNAAGVRGWYDRKTGVRLYKFVVGNALAGDTLADCDYLDPGDLSGVAAAVAALGANPGTVFVRAGYYTATAAAAQIQLGDSQAVVGAGVGQTVITARAGNVATLPWMLFRLNGVGAKVSDMTIVLGARAVTVPVPVAAVPVIDVRGQYCEVRRVLVAVNGNITAVEEPVVAFYLGNAGANLGGQVFEDIDFDFTGIGTVTGVAGTGVAFIGLGSFTSAASLGTQQVVDLGFVPAPVISRFRVINAPTDVSAVPSYASYGVIFADLSQFALSDFYLDGCALGVACIVANNIGGAPTYRGFSVERGRIFSAGSAFVYSGVQGVIQGTQACSISGCTVYGVECVSSATGSEYTGYALIEATGAFVRSAIENCAAEARNTGYAQIAFAGGTANRVHGCVTVVAGAGTGEAHILFSGNDGRVTDCTTEFLGVTAGNDNIVSNCRVTDPAGFSDTGTGTSISNLVIG